MTNAIQAPSIILPTVQIVTGAEVETINTAAIHTSRSVLVASLREKQLQCYCTEIVTGAGPGPLNIWVQLAPYDVAASYINLGGPTVVAATGVTLTLSTVNIPWRVHSEYCRVVCQALGAGAADFWMVQFLISAGL